MLTMKAMYATMKRITVMSIIIGIEAVNDNVVKCGISDIGVHYAHYNSF